MSSPGPIIIAPPGVDELTLRTAAELAEEAVSANTRRTYANAWRGWAAWCATHGTAGLCVSADERDAYGAALILFLSERVNAGVRPSTAGQVIHAIRYVARRADSVETLTALAHPQLQIRLKGLSRRDAGARRKQAEPLTLELLGGLYRQASGERTARGARDAALIATGVGAALRASSIGALDLNDVGQAQTIDGVVLKLRRSKTDQIGRGVDIPIRRAIEEGSRHLDPVAKLNAWARHLRAAGAKGDGPLFPRVRGNDRITADRLSNPDQTITNMLRGRIRRLGVDEEVAARFSSHSLRASFVTLSAAAGTSELDIAKITGHTSLSTVGVYRRVAVEKVAQTDYLRGPRAGI